MGPLSREIVKRITRLESCIEIKDPSFKSRLINRNPRNLEMLAFEQKLQGFWLDKNSFTYWNKLNFHKTGNSFEASLEHWSGKKLVTASTNEPQLQKYFKNINTQAAILLARLISTRCLQAGYTSAVPAAYEEDSDNVDKHFYKAAEEEGLTLTELPPIYPRIVTDL